MAERSLPTPEIRGLNPDIGNEIYRMFLSVNCYLEKTKIKQKRPGMAFFKIHPQESSPSQLGLGYDCRNNLTAIGTIYEIRFSL